MNHNTYDVHCSTSLSTTLHYQRLRAAAQGMVGLVSQRDAEKLFQEAVFDSLLRTPAWMMPQA